MIFIAIEGIESFDQNYLIQSFFNFKTIEKVMVKQYAVGHYRMLEFDSIQTDPFAIVVGPIEHLDLPYENFVDFLDPNL